MSAPITPGGLDSVLRVHPKADCIRVERSHVVSAVYTNRDGLHGCWPIGVGESEALAWAHAADHWTVKEAA